MATCVIGCCGGMYRALVAGIFLIFVASGCLAQEASADEETSARMTFGVETAPLSRYIWRGLSWSNGAVMQPSFWVVNENLTAMVSANFDMDHHKGNSSYNELDFYLYYSKSWNNFSVEPTVQYYRYPSQEDSPPTGEFALKMSYSLSLLTVFTEHTLDFIEYRNAYFGSAGLGYERETDVMSISITAYMGWGSAQFNEIYIGPRKDALNLAGIELSCTYYATDSFYLRPNCAVSRLLDSELKTAVTDPGLFVFGLAAGMDF